MSLLPGQILPQTIPFGTVDKAGNLTIDQNWYLFLYNLSIHVLSGAESVSISGSDMINMVDLDATGSNIADFRQQLANIALIAQDNLLPDHKHQAQPSKIITLTASPFTYTALDDGLLSISGPTMSGSSGIPTEIDLIHQGVTIPTGIISGLVQLRRGDQVMITYSTAPTVIFLKD